MEFQALVPGSVELHLLCHVTLLYCQVDPNPKPKAKSKAKKSLLPLPILPLMWQSLAHLNQCYSSNSLPFLPCGLQWALTWYYIWCLIPIHVASMVLGLNLDTRTTLGYTLVLEWLQLEWRHTVGGP